MLKLEDDEGKTNLGIINEILDVNLNNKVFRRLYRMKLEKKVDFTGILQDIFQKGLEE